MSWNITVFVVALLQLCNGPAVEVHCSTAVVESGNVVRHHLQGETVGPTQQPLPWHGVILLRHSSIPNPFHQLEVYLVLLSDTPSARGWDKYVDQVLFKGW